MKTCLLITLLMLTNLMYAQNWSIFNSYDRYNFKEDTSSIITNQLFADSFQVSGIDSVYYTNKIVSNIGYYNPGDTALNNSAQFLHAIIKRSTDGTYTFYDDTFPDGYISDTCIIHSLADSGDEWVYDSTKNITATVTSITPQVVFGQVDSVKHITLSDGNIILLSQSFGLLQFTADTVVSGSIQHSHFNLAGIETRGLGDSLINFWTVFNFNVGDVFFYQDNGGDFAGPDFGSGYWKYTITGKTVLSDSIQYKIMEDRYSEYYSSFYNTTTYSQIRDTAVLTFCDSINHLANTYPGQYLNAVSQMYYPMINYLASCSNCGETYAAYFSHPYFPVLCKAEPASYSNANGNVLVPNGYDDNGMQDNGAQGNCMICAGLGPVTYNWSVFEGGQSEELVGYTKNGISYGTILAIPDINNNVSHLQVYPTIVRENINVFISEPVNPNKLNFTLYDLTGRQMLNQELNTNRASINCGKLASALYVWRVTDAQQNIVGSGKLVKQ